MDAATITALCTGIVAILGAIPAIFIAVKAHARATNAGADALEASTIASGTADTLQRHIDVHPTGGNQS